MQVFAKARYVRTAPLKARIVADVVRGKRVEEALAILKFTPNRAARLIEKVVASAAANAENNNRMNYEQLYVSTILIDEAPRWKRLRSAPQGRVYRMVKRNAHITVGVEEGDFEVARHTGSRGSARPSSVARPAKKSAKVDVAEESEQVKVDQATASEAVAADADEQLENVTQVNENQEQPEENE